MKKILSLLLLLTILLMACQKNEERLKVIVPNGVPSIAQSHMEYNMDNLNFDIERVSGPEPLMAAFTSESHDFIIAPINLGANLYQKGSSYRLAGVLTWSNLQIISKEPIFDIRDLGGKDIIAFGQGSTPEMIISYLFNQINLENPLEINYQAGSAQESLLTFMQTDNAIAVVSEPLTTKAKSMVDNLYVLDLADLWTQYTGYDLFPLAGVFVHKDLSEKQVKDYLIELDKSSEAVLSQLDKTAEYCESMDYPFDKSMIESSIPRSQINFKYIEDQKKVVNDFMNLIYEFKPALIGNELPDENWFYSLS